jgi:hypothetical protein
MTTIVSAFISNVNNRHDMNLDKYFNYGILLLQSQVPKVIFVDLIMYEKIKEYENGLTKIILIDKTKYYLYYYMNNITNFNVNNGNPTKDTLEYMFTMCHKTEWIKEAIQLDYFNTNNFIWIDFGIRYIFKCSNIEFIDKINNIQFKNYDKIRIGNIWDLNSIYQGDLYSNVFWYFAGSVFGGNKDYLLTFSDKMKEKCIQIIKEKNTIMWEVNIWYLIYMENKDLFDCYLCDHNDIILINY